jgi:hypothetical protein
MMARVVARNAFVVDPIWKIVRVSTGTLLVLLRTPKPLAYTSCSPNDDSYGQARHVERLHSAGNVGLEFRDQRLNAILNGRAGLGLFRCERHVLKVKAGQCGDRQER